MASPEELRLWTRVASLYYEHKLKQTEVAHRLGLSQATVSRALRRAEEEGIVRITLSAPVGTYPELEAAVRERYDLLDAIVVDPGHDEQEMLRNLGSAGAFFVETTLGKDEVIGVSSWSETLLAMTRSLRPASRASGAQVLQILGGVGNPVGETHASHLTRQLATLLRADVTLLPAPGVVGSSATAEVMRADPYVASTMRMFGDITLALVGIGSMTPSKFLATSGNVFTHEELDRLREAGAVGDVCLRFFDASGAPVSSPVQERVIGIELDELREVPRTVGIAGGARKFEAIKGAVLGRWVNLLITDAVTAAALVDMDEHGAITSSSQGASAKAGG